MQFSCFKKRQLIFYSSNGNFIALGWLSFVSLSLLDWFIPVHNPLAGIPGASASRTLEWKERRFIEIRRTDDTNEHTHHHCIARQTTTCSRWWRCSSGWGVAAAGLVPDIETRRTLCKPRGLFFPKAGFTCTWISSESGAISVPLRCCQVMVLQLWT